MSKVRNNSLALTGPPALRVEMRPICELRPNPRNARVHPRKQLMQTAASIREFSFTAPVLLGRDDVILAGHGRVEAAKMVGMTEVPTIMLGYLTPAQMRAYAIADNRLAELAGWDTSTLALELQDLAGLDFDVEITGFDGAELDTLLDFDAAPDAADDIPPLGRLAVNRFGDLWRLGEHGLISGDARERAAYEALMGGELARMVFTDPPYNVQIAGNVSGKGRIKHENFVMGAGEMAPEAFTGFLEASMMEMARASLDGAIHYIAMDWRHIVEMIQAGARPYGPLKQLIVWVKPNGGQGSFYRSQHELIFVFKAGSAPHVNNFGMGETGRYRTNVWSYPGANTFRPGREADLAMHPTVKPVAMVVDAIKDVSRRGEIVLDPFGGSGTTLIAAQKTRRRARLIELDPIYADVICRRWTAFSGEPAILAATGQTFDEVAAERGVLAEGL